MNFGLIQKTLKIGFMIIVSQFFGLTTYADSTGINPLELPKLTEFVTDFSSILSSEQRIQLNTLAKEYETKTSTQIVTVLFPHRQGNELFEIGMKIFRDNQIGQKDKNNGLLLIIATDEKKIRIVVGYGLEGSMPDGLAKKIIEENIRPRVNSGDFYQAVKNFYERTIPALDTFEGQTYSTSNSGSDYSDFNIFLILAAFFFGSLSGSKVGDRANGTKNDHIYKKRIKKRRWLGLLSNILLFGVFAALGFVSSIVLLLVIFFSVMFSISFLIAYFGYTTGDYFGGSGRGGGGGRSGGGGFGGGSFDGGGGSSGGGGAGD